MAQGHRVAVYVSIGLNLIGLSMRNYRFLLNLCPPILYHTVN